MTPGKAPPAGVGMLVPPQLPRDTFPCPRSAYDSALLTEPSDKVSPGIVWLPNVATACQRAPSATSPIRGACLGARLGLPVFGTGHSTRGQLDGLAGANPAPRGLIVLCSLEGDSCRGGRLRIVDSFFTEYLRQRAPVHEPVHNVRRTVLFAGADLTTTPTPCSRRRQRKFSMSSARTSTAPLHRKY